MDKLIRKTFPKDERLYRQKQIELLFANGQSLMAFPLRIQYLLIPDTNVPPAQTLFSVPKKRFKRAVKRNLIKRRMKEAFRLNKHDFYKAIPEGYQLLAAIVYLETNILPYRDIEKALQKALTKLTEKISDYTT